MFNDMPLSEYENASPAWSTDSAIKLKINPPSITVVWRLLGKFSNV